MSTIITLIPFRIFIVKPSHNSTYKFEPDGIVGEKLAEYEYEYDITCRHNTLSISIHDRTAFRAPKRVTVILRQPGFSRSISKSFDKYQYLYTFIFGDPFTLINRIYIDITR